MPKCEGPNVITGRYGTIGEVYYHDGPCWPLNTTLYVSDFKGNSPQYVYYLLKYALKELMFGDGSDKSTVPGIDRNVLHMLHVPYESSIEQQTTIVALLSSIDSKIETNGKIIAELESLARTIYDYWFTQFDFPDENGNPYRSSGGTMVHNNTLHRDIPKSWEVKTAAELVSINRGISYSADELSDTGKPMINLASFNMDGTYKVSGLKRFTGIAKETKLLSPTDLVMCATQQTPIDATGKTDVIAKTFLVPDIYEESATLSMDVVRLVERREGVRFILNQMLRRSDYHKFASGYASGTKIKHLDVEGALSFPIALPKNQTLLDSYATLSTNLQGLISTILKESARLTALRDWLLPFLMNGQAVIA